MNTFVNQLTDVFINPIIALWRRCIMGRNRAGLREVSAGWAPEATANTFSSPYAVGRP